MVASYIVVVYFHILLFGIRNRCILILWVFWRPAMGSSGSRTPRDSHSVSRYRFRLLGDGFKIKSVTPYHSQSERGTQPWGGGKFSASPWEGEGGREREEKCWGPRGWEEKSLEFFLSFPGGGGCLQSGRAGEGGLVSSLTRRDSSGQGKRGGALGVDDVAGGRKENYVWN